MTGVADVEAIKTLLQEALFLTKDPEVTKRLSKCKDLATGIETRKNGILGKFCLDGQVAFVTGGGQGIGRGFCHALGEAGCKVAVADLELSRSETVVAELKAKGVESIAIKVDVSNKSDVQVAVQKCITTFGDLHIGVNNAGIVSVSNSEDTPQSDWDRHMGTNLDGVFFCCQAEAKHMLSKGYGKIINMASMSAKIVNHPQKHVAYNTSKAGVVHLTKTLGTEWASRGVRVNSISPGYVNTAINEKVPIERKKNWIRDTPIGRLADVDDLTGAMIYLASPVSNYVTGCNLIVDGGYTVW